LRTHALTLLVLPGLGVCAAQPALAASKETIRMMEQLDALQQAVQNIQKTVDTQSAVLKTLVEQTSDSVNAMKATVESLQKTNAQNLAKTDNRFDALTSQVQALSESLEEAKTRLAKLTDQMAQTQNIIQTLNATTVANNAGASPPGSPPGAGSPPAQDPKPRVPDANTLYESGQSDYNGGRYDLAIKDFQQYLQYYPDTELASNAQFYIGECYYNNQDYARAIEEYNKCLDRYPTGSKLPASQLKKGYALLELGQTQAGARELRSLIQRYPNSREAELASQRLKKLTAAAPPARKRVR
jgi:tol-pal system protein YbgF